MKTTDLCDTQADLLVAEPLLADFGGAAVFGGRITTLRVFEDNTLVRAALEEPGAGRVLVVDGGGSLRCALVGDLLAALGQCNGWAGVVVNGCVRDTAELREIEFGLRALAACPRRSAKGGAGERDVPVTFAGVTFTPGHYLYADADGIVVSSVALT